MVSLSMAGCLPSILCRMCHCPGCGTFHGVPYVALPWVWHRPLCALWFCPECGTVHGVPCGSTRGVAPSMGYRILWHCPGCGTICDVPCGTARGVTPSMEYPIFWHCPECGTIHGVTFGTARGVEHSFVCPVVLPGVWYLACCAICGTFHGIPNVALVGYVIFHGLLMWHCPGCGTIHKVPYVALPGVGHLSCAVCGTSLDVVPSMACLVALPEVWHIPWRALWHCP